MRFFFAILAFGLSILADAETTYLGLYLQGSKIGYSSYASSASAINGQHVDKSDSTTVMDLGLLGQAMKIQIDSTTWTLASGKPMRMKFVMTSGGRTQHVEATFGAKDVSISVENGGQKSVRTLPYPEGSPVVDDPLTLVLKNGSATNTSRKFYVLDPTTVSFVANEVKVLPGLATSSIKGKSFRATAIEIKDPRATMTVYVSSKGDLLKVEGPMGIEMLPESKALAMGLRSKYDPKIDLASSTSIKPDKTIEDATSLSGLKLRVSGRDLSGVPSDDHQTVTRDKDSWIFDIHPTQLSDSVSIAEAARQKPEWTKPGLDIPSDHPTFRSLAKKIIGNATDVISATHSIRGYVYKTMIPNAGIGVLRDATEVLSSKEGVCRDYAILTATLLRAAGIPAKLASGLVYWEGAFYYHAWAEAWDGKHWIGVDSTVPQDQLSANHIELADGNVDTAFTFAFLDHAKIEVLSTKKS